ncbi:MAG: triose-phosphate isomerase [Thalassotalea sp.]
MQRLPIIIANWKLNGGTDLLCAAVASLNQQSFAAEVVICPPYLYLRELQNLLTKSEIKVGSQNISQFESGAYTGETSAQMIADAGIKFCLIGHSERREIFEENDDICHSKMQRAFASGITPVLCIGESLKQRESMLTEDVLSAQLNEGLANLDFNAADLCIAYEPVWAIGTGVAATPEMVQCVHAFIRQALVKVMGADLAQRTRILYGGSVNQGNAEQLLAAADIDGLLVGGASLDIQHFAAICAQAGQTEPVECA